MTDAQALIRDRRAAINTLPPAERPAALAALADLVEDEAALPGVARALRLQALEAARAIIPDDTALIASLDLRVKKVRVSPRPCPRDRPLKPDGATWKERMEALGDHRRGRSGGRGR